MPVSRYRGVQTVVNDLEEHSEFLEARGKKFILQHRSREFKEPSGKDAAALHHQPHLWKQSDRYWKLAEQYYSEPRYWWVIAQYNQKPTEAFLKNGDIVIVPQPLQQALRALGY
tara:strand:- start:32 stop:373 length:342 start_codon:yes stop_codon:yes gene_type:complete